MAGSLRAYEAAGATIATNLDVPLDRHRTRRGGLLSRSPAAQARLPLINIWASGLTFATATGVLRVAAVPVALLGGNSGAVVTVGSVRGDRTRVFTGNGDRQNRASTRSISFKEMPRPRKSEHSAQGR